ncbi:uncharacterized protein [Spinacia oleracea]|uniref:Pectinesterase inhibitor domain-containing protein n=1 Tax=Spinacia oleracea TaxID=3562 RepID=A0A9R0K5U9_SPIOL|nr:uncharacterized protein LOC110797819 [Spinacia oleracea]
MMHNVWSPCLLSLLLIFFFIASTATTTTTTTTSFSHHDGHASRTDDINKSSKAKVTPMLAKAAEALKRMNNAKRQTSLKKSFSKDNVVVTRCDYNNVAKVSSKSIPTLVNEASITKERCQKIGRKLIPGQQDMDAFVTYADYRGPQRHPPKNN